MKKPSFEVPLNEMKWARISQLVLKMVKKIINVLKEKEKKRCPNKQRANIIAINM